MRTPASSRTRLGIECLEARLTPALNLSPLTAVPLSPIVATSIPQESLHIHHYDLRTEGGIQALFAQTGVTAVSLDAHDSAEGTSVAADGSGNVYVGGDFTAGGMTRIYVAKFTNGTQSDINVVDLGDGGGSLTCKGVAVDSNGNVAMCGGAMTPSGNLSYVFAVNSTFDTFLVDLAFGPGSSSAPQALNAIAYDTAGELFATGVYSPTPSESNIEFIKVDTGGNPQVFGQSTASALTAATGFGVQGSSGLGVGASANGSTWAVGGYATLSSDPTHSVVIFGDIFVVGSTPYFLGLTSDPRDTWGQDAIAAVAVGADGKQYFAGQAHLTDGTAEAILIKRGAGMTLPAIYVHEEPALSGSGAFGLAVTASGQAVLTGSVPTDTGTQGLLLLIGDGGTTGTLLDEFQFGDPASNTTGTGVVVTSDGSVWVVGNSDDPANGENFLAQFTF